MPKMQNQKYLMKIDLGGGNYRYLYTQEEVAAYKAGKTGGNQSHGEDHYKYQTTDYTRTKGVTTGRQTNVRNNSGSITRTTDRKHYTGSGQLIRGRKQNPDSGNSSQLNYRYQTSRNGKTEVRTGTDSVERTIPGDPVANRKRAEQLKNAPQNHGGASSSSNYRYFAPTSKTTTNVINTDRKGRAKGVDERIERSWGRVRNGKGTYESEEVDYKTKVTPVSKRAKAEHAIEQGKTKAKRAVKAAPGKAKATAKKVAKGYDNATTKIADSALKATPKIKNTAKKVAKGYDNATTKIADSALKATPKIKNTAKKVAKGYDSTTTKIANKAWDATHSKTAKKVAKNYDNATTKIANAAWDAAHSKTAQKAKKTVSSGAKKASNALTKAWNNLFKKKKK